MNGRHRDMHGIVDCLLRQRSIADQLFCQNNGIVRHIKIWNPPQHLFSLKGGRCIALADLRQDKLRCEHLEL